MEIFSTQQGQIGRLRIGNEKIDFTQTDTGKATDTWTSRSLMLRCVVFLNYSGKVNQVSRHQQLGKFDLRQSKLINGWRNFLKLFSDYK